MTGSVLTDLPALVVAADGADVPTAALVGVHVQQRAGLPALAELTFADLPAGSPLTRPGAALRVTLALRQVPLFEGEVAAVEHEYGPDAGRLVRVRALDRLAALRRARPLRAYQDTSVAAVARELCADAGLQVQSHVDGPALARVLRLGEDDLTLLGRLAARAGIALTVRGDVLHLHGPDGIGAPVRLGLGRELREARVVVDGTAAYDRVDVSGWDTATAEQRHGVAGSARTPAGRPRASSDAGPGAGDGVLAGAAVTADAEADAAAQALLDTRAAATATLWAVAEGDPQLRPGTVVEVDGLAADVTGAYCLTAVTHHVDDRAGYTCELSSAPPDPPTGTGDAATGTLAVLGVVSDVDDPDGLGRVALTLPAYGDVATGWLPVVCPSAGPDRGLASLPDVGDRVLALLDRADPAHGSVVGGLYGTDTPPGPPVEGGEVRRHAWRTAGGHELALDTAADGGLALRDARDSRLSLAADLVELHAAADLTIQAPGRTIRIRAAAIDFERA